MYPVYFVSLGPGEAELITLKGLKALQSSDCIYYPATTAQDGTKSSRALDILTQLEVDRYSVPFLLPMSKDRSKAVAAYDGVYRLVREQAEAGKRITVVAEGDAGFYSSIHYVYDKLESDGIEVKHIAGIPAFIAAGALAGIHIVKQEEELNVIPGIITSDELIHRIDNGRVVVIMKVSQCAGSVKDCIKERPHAQYHYFENIGVAGKEFYTQDTALIQTRSFPYFSLMIISRNDEK